MFVVVDSSVALKWFLNEPDSAKARALLISDRRLLAPDLLLAEVANGLRRQERKGAIAQQDVLSAGAGLIKMFSEFSPAAVLIEPALRLSQATNYSVYDCLFLAMSQLRGAPLVTADAMFTAKVAGTAFAPNVVLLSDWKP